MKKALTLIYLLLIGGLSLHSQPFQKTFGSPLANDEVYFKQLNNGDLFLVGKTDIGGDYDIWVTKLDASLNSIWSNRYRHDNTEEQGKDIIEYNGGYLVAGTRNTTNIASYLQLDQNGNLLQYSEMGSVQDRMFYLRSNFENQIISYGFLENWAPLAHNRPTIMLMDQNLNIQLKRSWNFASGTNPEPYSNEGYSHFLGQFTDSSYVMLSTGNALNTTIRYWRILLLDKNFNLISVKGLEALSNGDMHFGGCMNNDNTFMMCGSTNNYGANGIDMFIGKFTSNGDPIWLKRYGWAADESAQNIVPDGNGGHYVIGYTTGTTSSGEDGIIMRIDSLGNMTWVKSYGANGTDHLERGEMYNGFLVASGYSNSFSNNNTNDGWIVMIDSSGVLGDSCSIDITNQYTVTDVTANTVTRMYDNQTFSDPILDISNTFSFNYIDSIRCISCSPPQFSLPNDTLICEYDSLTIFNPNPTLPANWHNGDTTNQVTVPAGTTVWLELADSNCIASDTINVLSNTVDIPLESDSILCQTDSFMLSIPFENNTSYNWSTGSDTNFTTIYQSGIYSLTITDSIGCIDSDSILLELSYINIPFISDTTVCIGEPFLLTAPSINGFQYTWSNGDTNNSTTYHDTGTILLSITDTLGCSINDTIQVAGDSTLHFDLGEDTTICAGNSVQWDFSSYTGYTFTWNNTTTADLYQTDDKGITTLIARKDSSVCVTSDSIEILIEDTLATRTFGDTLLCREELDVFQEYISKQPYYLANSYNDSIATSQSTQGVFYFSFSNQCDVDTYKITANLEYCYCEPIIPNVFTPNRDYINDGFTILLTCYPYDYELWIFNRWGKQLFYSDQYGVSWSGTLEGEECPDGVYFYIVHYKTSANGSLKTAKGTVTLLR
ncbi:MAG: hypothetical protein CL843_01645 [Crocinitomicaceae bacterium]|nr:hypothetical protein [Crocinitomicaceae bacterium]